MKKAAVAALLAVAKAAPGCLPSEEEQEVLSDSQQRLVDALWKLYEIDPDWHAWK